MSGEAKQLPPVLKVAPFGSQSSIPVCLAILTIWLWSRLLRVTFLATNTGSKRLPCNGAVPGADWSQSCLCSMSNSSVDHKASSWPAAACCCIHLSCLQIGVAGPCTKACQLSASCKTKHVDNHSSSLRFTQFAILRAGDDVSCSLDELATEQSI